MKSWFHFMWDNFIGLIAFFIENDMISEGGGALQCVIDLFMKEKLFHLLIRALIAGGGAPEIEVAVRLMEYSQSLSGMEAYCVRAYAEAMEVIPLTLAENAGLNPIGVVTELRKRHANGEKSAGINVRKVREYNV